MPPLTTHDSVHFIGLGGIGMSALARILLQKGISVQGSDLGPSALLDSLRVLGATVHIGHRADSLDGATLVVYSTDIKEHNVEFQSAKERGLPLLHRSELLHLLMNTQKPLLVTGTHGKTTTTALLASALGEADLKPSFVIGGIARALQSNAQWESGPYFVAEADESDGSFLRTRGFGAIVTNLDNDHLDYWKTPAALEKAFQQFLNNSLHPEHLFWCGDDARLKSLNPQGVSYGFGPHNALRLSKFEASAEGVRFAIHWRGKQYPNIELNLLGRHNALNAAAVFGLLLSLGVEESAIRNAFKAFKGTLRRLEHKGTAHAVDVYDDYGHHPTEIRATLLAVRERVFERRIVAVFQPHRFTRVRDLQSEFVESFEEADLIALTDIYSAGETPLPGVTTAALYEKMHARWGSKVHLIPRGALEEGVAKLLLPHDVVLTLGAGDVTRAGVPILDAYKARKVRLKVAVMFGGTSAEHPVALKSARNIINALNPALYELALFGVTTQGQWIHGPDALDLLEQGISLQQSELPHILGALSECDVAIPVFHGPQGEDGMMQGILDALQIPYVGCDYRSAALCMHKGWTKQVALCNGVQTAPALEIDRAAYRRAGSSFIERVEEEIAYPVWVKPVHLGSSIGITRAANRTEMQAAIALAFTYDDILLVEKEVEGRQIEWGVLGNEWIRLALPCEVLSEGAFYDYDKKYTPGACGYAIPARITDAERANGEQLAIAMYQKSGCQGLARIDFFIDAQGQFWMNEINPFPGFTSTSAYPQMWKKSGVEMPALCDALVTLALHKSRRLKEVRGKQWK